MALRIGNGPCTRCVRMRTLAPVFEGKLLHRLPCGMGQPRPQTAIGLTTVEPERSILYVSRTEIAGKCPSPVQLSYYLRAEALPTNASKS
jgi:hypothetical protein